MTFENDARIGASLKFTDWRAPFKSALGFTLGGASARRYGKAELDVLEFYRAQEGRKFDVALAIVNQADPHELARADSKEHADEILKRANSLSVFVGAGLTVLGRPIIDQ